MHQLTVLGLYQYSQSVSKPRNVTPDLPEHVNCSKKWAWLRLGLYQMKYEDVTSAVSSLQTALRLDSSDRFVDCCINPLHVLIRVCSSPDPYSMKLASVRQTVGIGA